jgi:hypothetical protein
MSHAKKILRSAIHCSCPDASGMRIGNAIGLAANAASHVSVSIWGWLSTKVLKSITKPTLAKGDMAVNDHMWKYFIN